MPRNRRPYPPNRGRDIRKAREAVRDGSKAQIDRINTLTQTARASWFGLLSYLAFVGITLMGVEDADFFITERQTELPLIGVSIPTLLFFWVAPFLGLLLFAYFHLHLLKLWEALGEANQAKGSTPLGDRISPWLISDFSLARRPDDAIRKRPLQLLANAATLVLVFFSAPAVLAGFWWTSFPAHSEAMTVLAIGVPLSLACYIAFKSWAHLHVLATGIDLFPLVGLPRARAGFCFILAVTAIFGWFKTEGTLAHYARHGFGFELLKLTDEEIETKWWAGTPYPNFLARADLANINFVDAPPDLIEHDLARIAFRAEWCGAQGIPPQACSPDGKTGEESGRDFARKQRLRWCADYLGLPEDDPGTCDARFRDLEVTFEADWKIVRRSRLSALTSRKLQASDLRNASLMGARLEGADLVDARLNGADLAHARLEKARLWLAQLEKASLVAARLERADLQLADLQGANLAFARLFGTILRNARLDGADLFETKLNASTEFTPATLRGARLQRVDLSQAITNDAFHEAFGDGSVTLPDGLEAGKPPLEHWATDDLEWKEFQTRWRAWQREIGYTPLED